MQRGRDGVAHVTLNRPDDANAIKIPSSTVLNAGIVATRPYDLGNGFGVRGSVMVMNLADTKYVGSAYLNPDKVTISGVTAPAMATGTAIAL